MKYLTILIILISSCNLTGELYISEWRLPIKIHTVNEALNYVKEYNYKPKYGVFLPEEFYNNRYGDCEDFALMFQFILKTELNIDSDLVGGYYNSSNVLHMWVESNGIFYEPTAGIINPLRSLYSELYRYSYIESMRMIQAYGGFINNS